MPAGHWGVAATSPQLGPRRNKAASENRKDPGSAIQEFLIAGRHSPNVRSFHMLLEPEFGDKTDISTKNRQHDPTPFWESQILIHARAQQVSVRRKSRSRRCAHEGAGPSQAQIRAMATMTNRSNGCCASGRCPMSQKWAASSRGSGQFLFVRETAIRAGNVLSTRCTTVHVDSTAHRSPRRTDGEGLGPRASASDGGGWVCDRGCHVVTRPRDSHCSWLFSKTWFKCREIPARLNRWPLDKASSNLAHTSG
jgi:hypothetical protein